MILRPPKQCDWEYFSALASLESWRVPRSELQLFQGPWSQSAYVLDNGGFCGLVTSVAYEKSAWIGNLIVPHNLRGKGYGSRLFRTVFAGLVKQGICSIWLTASDQGQKIYEREGFFEVAQIERWILPPSDAHADFPVGGEDSFEQLMNADQLVWSDNRTPLISALCAGGKVFTLDDSIALLQAGTDLQLVGPWYAQSTSLHANEALLKKMILAADTSIPLVVDLFASTPLPSLCNSSGFQFTGRTALMAYGDIGSVDLKSMVSLASLGSVG